jgi:LemA protein
MKKGHIALIVIGLIVLIGVGSCVGKYNTMVGYDEGVKKAWGQVENQFQRRYDLIPNLVETVKGYVALEAGTFTAVTEARASVGQLKVDIDDPESLAAYQKAQSQLTGSLSRLLAVSESYPDLKANENFLALQDQLEGTENRIATERGRYNDSVNLYNVYIRRFPNNIAAGMFGFERKNLFNADEGAQNAPRVNFGG